MPLLKSVVLHHMMNSVLTYALNQESFRGNITLRYNSIVLPQAFYSLERLGGGRSLVKEAKISWISRSQTGFSVLLKIRQQHKRFSDSSNSVGVPSSCLRRGDAAPVTAASSPRAGDPEGLCLRHPPMLGTQHLLSGAGELEASPEPAAGLHGDCTVSCHFGHRER